MKSMEFLIFRLKKDKRFKQGVNWKTFTYIDEADSYYDAQKKAEALENKDYYVGVETISRYGG